MRRRASVARRRSAVAPLGDEREHLRIAAQAGERIRQHQPAAAPLPGQQRLAMGEDEEDQPQTPRSNRSKKSRPSDK